MSYAPANRRRFLLVVILPLYIVLNPGCQKPASDDGVPSATTPAIHSEESAQVASGEVTPEFVSLPASNDTLATQIARELERARVDEKQLLVYVGAAWCEPCLRFHEAVERGELASTFPTLRLVDLDFDRDQTRLEAAGYDLTWLPLFAVPSEDGRASGRRAAGAVKGDEAIPHIVPRVLALLHPESP